MDNKNIEIQKEFGPKNPMIPVINLFPGFDPKILEVVAAQNADSVVLVVFATGGSPSNLNEVIRSIVSKGTPVFLLASNFGTDHGITKIIDQTQIESLRAGAISIEKININDVNKLLLEIQKELAKGKRGDELGKAVQEYFSYKEGEERPIPEWKDPKRTQEK